MAIVVPHADKVKKWAHENGKTIYTNFKTNSFIGKDGEDLNGVV